MASINDTLEEIPKLQEEISKEIRSGTLDERFLYDLHNLIGVYYFDLLAHACMDSLSREIDKGKYPSSFQAYNNIARQKHAYQEVIKLNNIGALFTIWAKFEQFVYRHVPSTGKVSGDFQKAHKAFMDKQKIKRKRIKIIEPSFTGIRRARNSLHSDGIYYNEDGKSYCFELLGEKYTLEHEKPVTPIRLLSIVRFLIDHYYELQSSN